MIYDELSESTTRLLVDNGVKYLQVHHTNYEQLPNIIAIGRGENGYVCTLHSDGMINVIGYCYHSEPVDMKDLHLYIEYRMFDSLI